MKKESKALNSAEELGYSDEPILVTRFDSIKEKPKIEPELNDIKPILNNESFRRHSFGEAKKAFLFVFDVEKIRQCLSAPEPTRRAFRYLKRVRRFGLILRANYRFSDSLHMSPKSLHKFLSLLGDHNDRYWSHQRRDAPRKLFDFLDRIDEKLLTMNSVDNKNFREYAKGILGLVDSLLQRREMPVSEFHELRKTIRLCADLMQVAATEDYGGNIHWLFSSILSLSVRLGEKHDELVQKRLRKEMNHSDMVVQVDPGIRRDFARLRPFIEKIFGVS